MTRVIPLVPFHWLELYPLILYLYRTVQTHVKLRSHIQPNLIAMLHCVCHFQSNQLVPIHLGPGWRVIECFLVRQHNFAKLYSSTFSTLICSMALALFLVHVGQCYNQHFIYTWRFLLTFRLFIHLDLLFWYLYYYFILSYTLYSMNCSVVSFFWYWRCV